MWDVVTRSGAPHVQRDVNVTVPLPENTRPKRVAPASPTESPEEAEWEVKGNLARINVPTLKIYKAVEVELERIQEKP
jgi:hypothetical protein